MTDVQERSIDVDVDVDGRVYLLEHQITILLHTDCIGGTSRNECLPSRFVSNTSKLHRRFIHFLALARVTRLVLSDASGTSSFPLVFLTTAAVVSAIRRRFAG